ncbi:MAG TPA: DUF6291 domain-containing protein [Flavobacteriaceae bacterium]|nr:DUF6291 domain-containing protein [Flavobacteriaceae bacterium]
MNRDGFIFYRSFYEGIKELPREIQGEVLTAIMEYGLNGATTESLKPVAKAIFTLIKPQIDANNKKFENGSKGGRPSKKETEPKPNENQDETKQEPKPENPKPKEKEKEKVNVKEKVNEKRGKKKSFSPPKILEVYEYMLLKIPETETAKKESQKFHDFYESKNWFVGKNKMANWKSAVSGWINRMDNFKPQTNGNSNAKSEPTINRQSAETINSNLTGW